VIDADATPEYFSAIALRQRQRARRLRNAAAASAVTAPPR
jgi:hypothetical protein